MIEHLKYTVRFPPNDRFPQGQVLDRDIHFGPGATNIVGQNEVGKSFNFEVVEFLLFGSKALRGPADDYRHFQAEGTFKIRGERYTITRSANKAALSVPGSRVPTVVGTKPVNARIIQIMGYGLDVFRVANAALQGDSERLSNMLPAERKAMVDKLIGAQQVEAMARWCGEEALGVSREIAGLERGLGEEPTKPEKPAGYLPAERWRAKVDGLRAASDRSVELRAFLANPPVVPALGERPTELELETIEQAIRIWGLRTYDFDLKAVTDQLAGYERWEEKQRFNKQMGKQPTLTQAQIDLQNKRNGLARDRARLRQTPEILCPCGKPFTTADAEIARVEAEIAAIPQLEGYAQPDLDWEEGALRRWTREAHEKWQSLQSAGPFDKPAHHPVEAKGAVHVDDQREAIEKLGIDPALTVPELTALSTGLREHAAAAGVHAYAVKRLAAWEEQAVKAREELAGLSFVGLADAEQSLREAEAYETRLAGYTESFADWAQGRDRLTDLRREERSWRNGKLALNQIREDAKNFLVPALSRVASVILAEMTNGQRTRIVISEDFEIEVDGQPLNTLSGSGKVCANLAIRFGLGRVLTNNVFSVFLGDEVDGSMDAERADSLHEALFNLRHRIEQIIVITHKNPTFDQVVKLER